MSGRKLNRITEYVHCKICQQNTITFPLMTFGVNRSYQVQDRQWKPQSHRAEVMIFGLSLCTISYI